MGKIKIRSALCVAGGLLLASQGVYANVVDAVNEFSAPFVSDWGVPEVGWFYTPAFDYQLDGIETKFRTSLGSAVEVELYQDFEAGVGGTRLVAESFVPVAGQFSGAFFVPLSLSAGEQYFVAFKNTFEFGVNYTTQVNATNLGAVYASESPGGNFGHSISGVAAQPILRFLGRTDAVAEPATVLLLGLGLVALGLGKARRFVPV